MVERDDVDREGLAAEYVLGTLDQDERARAVALIGADDDFRRLVADWEARLAPLSDGAPTALVPQGGLAELLSRVETLGQDTSNVVALKRQVSRWRAVTGAVGALAASLLIAVAVGPVLHPAHQRFVAVLQASGENPAFLASIDVANGVMAITRVSASPEEGHSYELWALGAGRRAPQPLGVVDAVARIPTERLGTPSRFRDTVFAISLEPEGGSPTGEPTGPVLFTGKIVPVE